MGKRRTIRDISCDNPVWPVVDTWALEAGYRLKETFLGANRRLYQKGHGFWVAPMMLDISDDDGAVHIEAWVRVPLFNRIMVLFLMPAEMSLESGGIRASIPRKWAREKINELIEDLTV